MPVLDQCWTPLVYNYWTNVRTGSIYAAIYTAVMHILWIGYGLYAMNGGRTDYFFSPYFELSQYGTNIAASLTSILCLFFLFFCYLLIQGIRKNNRCLYFPWMISMGIEIFLMIFVGIWYIQRYYRNLWTVYAAIILWIADGMHIYCLLCVISNYQIVRDLQEPKFELLYD